MKDRSIPLEASIPDFILQELLADGLLIECLFFVGFGVWSEVDLRHEGLEAKNECSGKPRTSCQGVREALHDLGGLTSAP